MIATIEKEIIETQLYQNKIIYDWLTFTSKIHDVSSMVEFLGLTGVSFMPLGGLNGYKDRLFYDGISIMYNGREDMGICVQFSGQGCRTFETYGSGDFDSIFREILDNYSDTAEDRNMNITRLDVAYDDFERLIDIKQVLSDCQSGNFVSRCVDWSVTVGNKGCTINHGSNRSNVYIRIYDKKAEQRNENVDYWVRCELQIRGIDALGFIRADGIIDDKYFKVLNNYLRYVVPDSNDTNKWRWCTAPHWLKWLRSFSSESIYARPGVEYNIYHLDHYVYGQAGAAVKTMIDMIGVDEFVKQLNKSRENKPVNPKYKKVIAQYNELRKGR